MCSLLQFKRRGLDDSDEDWEKDEFMGNLNRQENRQRRYWQVLGRQGHRQRCYRQVLSRQGHRGIVDRCRADTYMNCLLWDWSALHMNQEVTDSNWTADNKDETLTNDLVVWKRPLIILLSLGDLHSPIQTCTWDTYLLKPVVFLPMFADTCCECDIHSQLQNRIDQHNMWFFCELFLWSNALL